jgi:hypothetical protein
MSFRNENMKVKQVFHLYNLAYCNYIGVDPFKNLVTDIREVGTLACLKVWQCFCMKL